MSLSRKGLIFGLLVFILGTGCGESGSTLHKVTGKVDFEGGDIQQLEGHHVILVSVDDPNVQASGMIEKNGQFKLETLEGGQVRNGIKKGTYKAKIALVDEGEGPSKKPKVPKRFLNFDSAGWNVTVPAKQVSLTIAQ